MPRTTNADRILNESAMRLEAARLREALAQSQLNTAKAVLEAIQQAHTALENALTPKPRKKPEKATASAPAQPPETESPKTARCGVCYEVEGYAVHDKTMGYADYHPFDAPKSVARARKRSSPKGSEVSSTPTSETEKETATAVGVSG